MSEEKNNQNENNNAGSNGQQANTDEGKTPGKMVSAGKPVAMKFEVPTKIPGAEPAPTEEKEGEGQEGKNTEGAGGENKGTGGEGAAKIELTAEQKLAAERATLLEGLSEDEIKALLGKKGIKVEGTLEELSAKLKPVAAEPTEEEKKIAETAKQNRIRDLFFSGGGTEEQWVAIKQIASMDLKELSVSQIRSELKEAGIPEAEIQEVIDQRYHQINLEELTQDTEETNEDFAKRKAKLEKLVKEGSERLNTYAKGTQQTAKDTINKLQQALETSDLQKREAEKEESEFLSKIDKISSEAPKKLTIELGTDSKGAVIPPVEFDDFDSITAEVVAELKDPAKRNQILLTEDGKPNAETLFDYLRLKKIQDKLLKAVFIEGRNNQIEFFKKQFPHQAKDLGVGPSSNKANDGKPGKMVSYGKPQAMSRPQPQS